MADRTGVPEMPSVVSVPHTEAETAALQDLYDHTGTRANPGCVECQDSLGGCEEGLRLRRAIRDASRARVGTTPVTERHEWCSWHRGYTQHAVLIDWHDTGSGPRGRAYFACPPCCEQHHLTPLADRPQTEVSRRLAVGRITEAH